jgi:hypothetical protein
MYSSPSIIRKIKSRRMRWAGHVARMHIAYWWESQMERDHWEIPSHRLMDSIKMDVR